MYILCKYGSSRKEKAPTRFRKKPLAIEATQWFKNGDHPEDECELIRIPAPDLMGPGMTFLTEGKVVGYFRHPEVSGQRVCEHCQNPMHNHGHIYTYEGSHIVCPGDWIVTGIEGERYPVKPSIFAATYEPIQQ